MAPSNKNSKKNKKGKGSVACRSTLAKSAKKTTMDSGGGVGNGEKHDLSDHPSGNNKQKKPENLFQTVPTSILYVIASMLDEVPLYCLEEAYPKEFKKAPVSHKRWKELYKKQLGGYKMTSEYRVVNTQCDIQYQSHQWPSIGHSETFFGTTSILKRGREYAKTFIAVKDLSLRLADIPPSNTGFHTPMPEDIFLYVSFQGKCWGTFDSVGFLDNNVFRDHFVEIRTMINEGFKLPELEKLINMKKDPSTKEIDNARTLDLKDFQPMLVRPSRLGTARGNALLCVNSKPCVLWSRRSQKLHFVFSAVPEYNEIEVV